MNYIGKIIVHIKYGNGTVTDFDGKYVKADFGGEIGEKTFVYPDGFDAYVRFEDESLQSSADKMLEKQHLDLQKRRKEEKKQKDIEDGLERERIHELCRPKKRTSSAGKK